MSPFKNYIAASIVALVAASALAATAAECPSGDGVDPNASVLVVVVDRTAARTATFNAGVVAAVSATIRPNTRAILWAFAGRGQPLPQLVLDVASPALPEKDVVDINTIAQRMFHKAGYEEHIQLCVLARVDDQRRKFLSALRAELETFDSSPNGSSPILLALGQAVQAVSTEAARGLVDVVVVTDGYEHSTEASFYPANSRYLTPAEALAKTRLVTGALQGARVSMAGIGVVNDSADTAGVSALIELWRAVLLARGATPIQLTTGPPQRLSR